MEIGIKRDKKKADNESWEVEYERRLSMTENEQLQLRESKWEDILKRAKELDQILAGNDLKLSEDEIADIVSEYRKEQYAAEIGG